VEGWLCSTQKLGEFHKKVHSNVRDKDIFKMSANWLYKPLLSEVFRRMTGVFSATFPHQNEEDQKTKWELIVVAAEIKR